MTAPLSPVSAVSAAAAAAGTGPTTLPIPNGYVKLDDTAVLERMLADDKDITTLLVTLRDGHVLDATGPLLEAFTRASVTADMLAIELRHIRNLLGGA